MIVDGDDELASRYVFSLINMKYQSRDNWMVYTNFFSSKYQYGGSKPLEEQFFKGERSSAYIFGALRTYYVDLYRKIKEKDHRDQYGKYFNTSYDTAMQYPLLEMAGL